MRPPIPVKRFDVGRTFTVFAFYDGGEADAGERIPLLIGPGRAFGSGEHDTTASCLEFLEDIPAARRRSVLDLGCGTGILAIAAVKTGSRSATAVDIEPDAVEAAARNAALNGVAAAVRPLVGTWEAVARDRFDLVVANIYGEVLLELAGDLPRLARPGGHLLLSGIRFEDAYEVKRAFAGEGRSLLKGRYREEYCTFLFGPAPR